MNFLTKHIRAISIALFVSIVAAMLILSEFSKPTEKTFFAFDTLIDMSLSGKNAEKVISALSAIENDYSKFRPKSCVSRFNSLPEQTTLDIPPEMADLIRRCAEISRFTDGAFDITTSALSDLWDVKNASAPPTESDISEALSKTGSDKISLSGNTLTKTVADIDFGGVLKGSCADKIREIAEKNGISRGIVNLGGNVCLIGSKKSGPWTVGIVNPFSPGEVYLTVSAENTNIITSGAYQRYFESDGKIYHHIISPFNGNPAESDIASATVISEDGTLADALSTAIFVLGSEKGIEIAKNYGVEIVLIKTDGSVWASEGVDWKMQNAE